MYYSYSLMNQQETQDGKATYRDLGKVKKSFNRQGFGMFLSLDPFGQSKMMRASQSYPTPRGCAKGSAFAH